MSGKWHVASNLDAADRHLAAAARLRRVLRHDHRRRQLLRSQHADARQRERRARGARRPASSTPTRSATRRSTTSSEHAREHAGTPFFAYVAYTAPHWPLHAHDEDIAKYKGRFDAGWDALREERLDRLVDSGILRRAVEADRRATRRSRRGREAEHKAWLLRCMEVYAAQVDRMDQGIGRIVAALEETGQLDDTLVIFLADNGACAEDIPEDVTVDELVDKLMIARSHTRERRAGALRQRSRTACRARRTRTRATAPRGRTCRTRRSASTSTGSTKAASRRR